MDTGITISIILGLSGIISAILWGLIPRIRKERVQSLKAELLTSYRDLLSFTEVENTLLKELSTINSEKENQIKIKIRKLAESTLGRKISENSEPARIKKRIEVLENEI